MGIRFWLSLLGRLLILAGWLGFWALLPILSVRLAVALWLLSLIDFYLWLRLPRIDAPRWFEWLAAGEGYYRWWTLRKIRKRVDS